MKYSKLILSILFAVIMSVVAAFSTCYVAASMGVILPMWAVALGVFVISIIPKPQIPGIAMAGVYKEVWTGEIIKALSKGELGTFLDGIRDYSRYVSAVGDENQAIHLTYFGVDPAVLINNTTYPIPVTALNGEDVVISLDKYQTEATPITDDELYALSYDKMTVVKERHASAILKTKIRKALHALAPSGNTAAMPVLLTTGADDGTGRKRLVWADLVDLKRKCDELQISEEGRRLVLTTDHENDLLLLDNKFKDQYYNAASGKPYSALGFEFYSYVACPYYTPSTKAKLSFGATPAGTDRRASIFFSMERAARATGWTKMYYSEAKSDPTMQRNLVNFRHNYIVMPTREEARGAIVSANV